MHKTIKILGVLGLFAGIMAAVLYGSFHTKSVQAFVAATLYSTNPNSPLATSTKAWINSGGTGTTTLTFNTQGIDQVDFNLIVQATSSLPVVKWRYEFSDSGVDWFSDDISPSAAQATTSPIIVQATFSEYQWNVASSTAGIGSPTVSNKHIRLPFVNAAFTRIVLYTAVGSAPANVWIEARAKNSSFIQ